MIDRAKFLNMCRECAMIKQRGVHNIPLFVPDRLKVIFSGAEYYPVGYELRFLPDGTACHIGVIHDLKANSICRVELKNIQGKAE